MSCFFCASKDPCDCEGARLQRAKEGDRVTLDNGDQVDAVIGCGGGCREPTPSCPCYFDCTKIDCRDYCGRKMGNIHHFEQVKSEG